MIQGLQGGQDVLIVPHMVHKVIWGRGKQKSGVTGGFCPCPWALPPILVSPTAVPSLISRHHTPLLNHRAGHLPHSSLVSTWLQREKGEGDSEASLPCRPPNPCSMHSPVQLGKHLLRLLSRRSALAPRPHCTGEIAAGKWHYPLLRTKQASMSAPV